MGGNTSVNVPVETKETEAIMLLLQLKLYFQLKLYQKRSLFPRVIQIYTNLQTLRGHIFHVLKHFATKLGNSTNFRMLFLTIVKDFVHLAQSES